jgi:hypothetical protein
MERLPRRSAKSDDRRRRGVYPPLAAARASHRFARIRYYGFLANCHRAAKLDVWRRLPATACSHLLPHLDQCREFLAALTLETPGNVRSAASEAWHLFRFSGRVMAQFRSVWIAHEVTRMNFENLQRCRVRQGVAVVCADAERGSMDSGRAHFPRLKSRQGGARPRHNQRPHPFGGAKTPDPPSPESRLSRTGPNARLLF